MKLKRSTIPSGHSFTDFESFGPPAIKDGEFTGTKIADFGYFSQDDVKSNKYYHACVCKSNKNSKWYTLFSWGKTGEPAFDYQFQEFETELEAQKAYEKQCHKKNDKRGEWYEHPQLGKLLRPKKGQDCYLVRNMATRLSPLPDAKKIVSSTIQTGKASKTSKTDIKSMFDPETTKLLSDLKAGTISYAKSSFSSGSIPDIAAIQEARKILSIAAKAPKKELDELTKILYSKIPKRTYVGETVELSSDNIKNWLDDLDAFESALNSVESPQEEISIRYSLRHVDKNQTLWYNINRLVESSTRNRHSYLPGNIKVINIWEVTNFPQEFIDEQERVAKEFNGTIYPLIFQPERTDLEKKSNTQLLFHGSRSTNIYSILENKFRLPQELSGVSINGAINGSAIYHGLDYRKSAGYCSINNSYWAKGSGSINNRAAFMFLNHVILGNSFVISQPRPQNNAPQGYHSVIADTKGSFQNEECMSYTTKYVYPKYLFEFSI